MKSRVMQRKQLRVLHDSGHSPGTKRKASFSRIDPGESCELRKPDGFGYREPQIGAFIEAQRPLRSASPLEESVAKAADMAEQDQGEQGSTAAEASPKASCLGEGLGLAFGRIGAKIGPDTYLIASSDFESNLHSTSSQLTEQNWQRCLTFPAAGKKQSNPLGMQAAVSTIVQNTNNQMCPLCRIRAWSSGQWVCRAWQGPLPSC